MAPMKHSMNSTSPVNCAVPGCYFTVLRATAVNDSNPTPVDPTQGVTWARASEGVYTVTFAPDEKPRRILWGGVNLESSTRTYKGDYVTYVPSTGQVTVNISQEQAGTLTADDGGGVITILLLCTNTSINDA